MHTGRVLLIIRPADDCTHDLETVQSPPNVADATTARRIQQEMRQIKAGISDEEKAADEMRVRLCWLNRPKFGGSIFCMDCQQRVAVSGHERDGL